MIKTGGTFRLAEKPSVARRYSGAAVVIATIAVILIACATLVPIAVNAEMGKREVDFRVFASGVVVALLFVHIIVSDFRLRDVFIKEAETALEKSYFRDVEIKMWSSYASCTFTARQYGAQEYAKYKVTQLNPDEYAWELIV